MQEKYYPFGEYDTNMSNRELWIYGAQWQLEQQEGKEFTVADMKAFGELTRDEYWEDMDDLLTNYKQQKQK